MRRARASGFTLLEIAVALAILGIGVVSCLEIFGASMRLQDRAARESRAVLHARVAMDALLFQRTVLNHVEERDTADAFHTRIEVRDAGADEGLQQRELDFESEFKLKLLRVDVTWQDGIGDKRYTLESLRLAQADDE